MINLKTLRIGTAGWSIPSASAFRFAPPPATHLYRYSRVLDGAEINSSFYRPHAAATYAKWRDSTPAHFRFAVKMPRTITHDRRLKNVHALLGEFLAQTEGLAEKRGPILVQLPPSFAFDSKTVSEFFARLRDRYAGQVACEPRHETWFDVSVEDLMVRFQIARVAADPALLPEAARPGGWPGLAYFRLHGSPRMYWSRYDEPFVARIESELRRVPRGSATWCVFDNTASGAAIEDAIDLRDRLMGHTLAATGS